MGESENIKHILWTRPTERKKHCLPTHFGSVLLYSAVVATWACCSARSFMLLVGALIRSHSFVRWPSQRECCSLWFILFHSFALFSFIQFHSRRRRLTEQRSAATKSLTSLYATFLSSCFYFSSVISAHTSCCFQVVAIILVVVGVLFRCRRCCCCCSQRVHWLRLTTIFFRSFECNFS